MSTSRSLMTSAAFATLVALSVTEGRAQQVTESPFRCDMSMLSAATRARKDTIGGILASRRLRVTPLPDGYEFQFPGDADTFSLVSEWLVTERLCCPFFDFEVRLAREGGPLALRLTGRPGTKAFIEADFGRWLKTDAADACPVSAPKANLQFVLRDLDGHAFNLATLAGHVVLLDFWATWCGPCRVEIPGFVDLYARNHPRGVDVVGIMVADEFVKARAFARDLGVNYPILDGTDRADVEQAFGVHSDLPTSFVIARDGRVCWKHIGLPPVPAGATDLKAATREVFAAEIGQLIGRAD